MTVQELLDEVRQAPPGPGIGAFFDFDGTLIDGYSAGALYAHRLKSLEVGPAEAVEITRLLAGAAVSEEQFVRLLSLGIAGWAGRQVTDLDELGERLFRQEIAGSLFHDMWRLVKAHQRRGHTVVIATSATRLQVAPLARELDIEHVLCTELEEENGILTGKVAGRTLWGPGKLAAVQEFAERHGIRLAEAYGYANGDEDIPFLDAVGRPRAVNPQPALTTHAGNNGWPVVRLRRAPSRFDPRPALRTAGLYGTLLGAGAAGIAVGVVAGRRRIGVDLATSLFAQLGGIVGDVTIDVQGEGNLWAHRPAVFLINHQSSLIDLLVTTTALRGGFTAVAKKEAAEIPVIGQVLRLADFAFIDRADSQHARQAMAQAADRLAAGTSIVISPEGTRSLSPRVGPFKKGAFHLAMQAGVPLVPIVIRNAGELMWRNAKTARTGTVQVVVHEPIPTTGWTKSDLDETVKRVHQLYVDTLEEWPEEARS